ncbi:MULTISPECIES: hypothetical protein [Streptomyces]|uniref:hypothetical protein n=1 Tax=Streptomyces TaxID=1883 RepID=UPI0029A4C357|nr:hypothetical protein [Streptomyces scabiei]MDX3205092.1 hypothetical protein [Streptomyces scabiei]
MEETVDNLALAPMPDHNRLDDPLWQKLWHNYSHVITPLRTLGLVTDVELCGGEYNVVADLPDGTHLLIAAGECLPVDPAELAGWTVIRAHHDNPTVDYLVYDSTDGGDQEENGSATAPMLGAITEWLIRNEHHLHLPDFHLRIEALLASLQAAPTRPEAAKSACHCLFAHPANDAERAALNEDLDYARTIGDLFGIQVALVRLTTASDCPARKEQP